MTIFPKKPPKQRGTSSEDYSHFTIFHWNGFPGSYDISGSRVKGGRQILDYHVFFYWFW